MLDEVEALLLLQRCLQVRGASDQARFAFLADAALEHGFHENRAVAFDQGFDLLLARVGAEHLRRGEAYEVEKSGSVQHAGDLHRALLQRGIGGYGSSERD
jgi:hypothetical protein